MATESLIVELDAKVDGFNRSMKEAESGLDNLDTTAKNTSLSMEEFKAAATKAALGATAVAAAIGVAVHEAAAFAREVRIASNRTGESVEKMQALAFATNTVGVSMEKLGDIGKDTNEKIGEFLATGGGGFKDFSDVMGLSERGAQDLAGQFEKMTGPDVLQAMVIQMESAGVSAERMSFALEGMASDTTDLLPLLTNGGEKLNQLTGEFGELGLVIGETDLGKIEQVGLKLKKAADVFSVEGKKLISEYSEELIAGIDAVLLFAQKSTAVFNVVTVGLGSMLKIAQAGFTDFVNDTNTLDAVIEERARLSQEAIDRLLGSDDPKEKGRKIAAEFSDGVIEGLSAGGDTSGGDGDAGLSDDENQKLIEQIEKAVIAADEEAAREIERRKEKAEAVRVSLLEELEALEEKYIAEKEILDQGIFDKEERDMLLAELEAKHQDKITDIKLKSAKRISDDEIRAARAKESRERRQTDAQLSLASSANTALLNDNKAIAKGLIVADTAIAIARQFRDEPFWVALGTSAVIAANAITQLSNAGSASRGGGPVSAGGGSISSSSSPQSAQADQETSALTITEQSEEGSQTTTIRFATDSGDTLLDAIASSLNERQRQGR